MGFINLLFKAILLSSAMGSFLVVIIILIKKLFKNKLSASWHYYIWVLLILRLAIPYSYQSPLSIFNIFTKTLSNTQVSLNIPNIKNSSVKSNVNNNNNNPIAVSEANIKDINAGQLDLLNIASIIWVIGMLSALLFIFIFNMVFNKRLKNKEICKDKETLFILKSCQAMTSTKGYIPIAYSSNISGASLYGMFKPQILISSKITRNFTVEQKRYIFLHELIHLKYKDILINSIMLILVALNWFNPIIWYSFYRMQQDCELACDEKVLHYLQPDCYNNYGSTIINIAELFSKSHNIFNGASLASNKSNLKRRISMINSFKSKSFKWSLIGIFTIALISVVFLVNPKIKSNIDNYASSESTIRNFVTTYYSVNQSDFDFYHKATFTGFTDAEMADLDNIYETNTKKFKPYLSAKSYKAFVGNRLCVGRIMKAYKNNVFVEIKDLKISKINEDKKAKTIGYHYELQLNKINKDTKKAEIVKVTGSLTVINQNGHWEIVDSISN